MSITSPRGQYAPMKSSEIPHDGYPSPPHSHNSSESSLRALELSEGAEPYLSRTRRSSSIGVFQFQEDLLPLSLSEAERDDGGVAEKTVSLVKGKLSCVVPSTFKLLLPHMSHTRDRFGSGNTNRLGYIVCPCFLDIFIESTILQLVSRRSHRKYTVGGGKSVGMVGQRGSCMDGCFIFRRAWCCYPSERWSSSVSGICLPSPRFLPFRVDCHLCFKTRR